MNQPLETLETWVEKFKETDSEGNPIWQSVAIVACNNKGALATSFSGNMLLLAIGLSALARDVVALIVPPGNLQPQSSLILKN